MNTERALRDFARTLEQQHGAERVLLFGSRAQHRARPDSDYDLIIVSPQFRHVERVDRARGLRQLWYAAGGDGPMDLLCLTPEEFDVARDRATLVAAVLPHAVSLLPTPA
jgi:predicted nucleotidyltransferase